MSEGDLIPWEPNEQLEPVPLSMVCVLCKHEVEPDDIAVPGKRIICLPCYERETGTERPMPKWLRLEITRAVNL